MISDIFSRRYSTSTLLSVVILMALVGICVRQALPPSRAGVSTNETQTKPLAKTAFIADPASANSSEIEPDAAGSWESRWSGILASENTPARNRQLAALLEELARSNPDRALELARTMDDWRLRDLFRNAAVRGWASVKPQAAADWALTVRTEDRRSVVEALMQGAAAKPAEAVETALRLCEADTSRAGDYGHYTIAALADAGQFQQAVTFGNEVGREKYPFLLKSAFFQWSRNQPTEAIEALDKIQDPVAHSQAESEVISGWSWADAKGLAAYALALPAGGLRTQALDEALPHWIEKDPIAASEWITQNDSGTAEFDAGISAIANLQSLVTEKPTSAMALAGNISDPAKREHTLRAVFRQWATNDPSSARHFIDSTANAADRAALENELKDMTP
jgi:hypothetical protein